MKRNKVELLAPAGNKEAFYGAVHAGADAVYLGGEKFGARAYADNFSTQELIDCIRYAHIWGRKIYLTVNTLVKEKEWAELYDYILPFYEAGLDGVIIQDFGVFLYIKECFPDLELHISTQMTLTGVYGASYMKELGACRIVPARELSLDEIRLIKHKTGLQIETFIHGAMCYCYSGQCLFSSMLGGRSGNRGRCAQPCRLPYKVDKGKECFPLSLKDMCTIEHIDELIEAGIDSFKIEGRMKKPEYAAGVTAIYRRAIDRYYEHPSDKKYVTLKELDELSHLYIRSERQNGYYHKHNGADMITIDSPAYSGSDEALLMRIREQYIINKPKLEVDLYASFHVGKQAELTLICDKNSITVYGHVVDEAKKQPVSKDNIIKQLSKLGDTVFSAQTINVSSDENAFFPLKEINDLRRKAVTELEDCIISQNKLSAGRTVCINNNAHTSSLEECKRIVPKGLTVLVTTLDQLSAVSELINSEPWVQLNRIYIESDILLSEYQQVHDYVKEMKQISVYAVLPYILRKRDHMYLDDLMKVLNDDSAMIKGCMVRSLEGYSYLKHHHYQGKITADAGFYIWNHKTLNYWSHHLESFCLPRELNSAEQKQLLENNRICAEKIIYGYIPMMISAGCVLKTSSLCVQDHKSHLTFLIDRYHKKLPVTANCRHCMNIIYNSIPLSLHNYVHKWENTCKRIDFTIENSKQAGQILKYFCGLLQEKPYDLPFNEYTTGHEKRGVE